MSANISMSNLNHPLLFSLIPAQASLSAPRDSCGKARC